MSNPDWARVGAHAPDKYGPLGDPTRWGTTIIQPVPFTSAGPHDLISEQLISVACRDLYARNWSIIGTVAATAALWTYADGLGVVGAGPQTWSCIAVVRMGVAQNTIVHNINLRATITADAPFYVPATFQTANAPPIPPSSIPRQYNLQPRAFVIPGAIASNQISIQIRNIVQYNLPPLPDGDAVQTSLQLAPMAAGTGL